MSCKKKAYKLDSKKPKKKICNKHKRKFKLLINIYEKMFLSFIVREMQIKSTMI